MPSGGAFVGGEDDARRADRVGDDALGGEDPLVALAHQLVGGRAAPEVAHRPGAAGGGVRVDEVADAVEAGGRDGEVGREVGERRLDRGALVVLLRGADRGHGRVACQQRGPGGVGQDGELGVRVGLGQRVHARQHHDQVAEPAEEIDHEDPAHYGSTAR